MITEVSWLCAGTESEEESVAPAPTVVAVKSVKFDPPSVE